MRTITVRYASECRNCGRAIAQGERADWGRGQGVRCAGGCTGRWYVADDGTKTRVGFDEEAARDASYERAMARAEARRENAEIAAGAAEVAQIQAISAPGSAFREQLYMEAEMAAYNAGID